MLPVLVMVVEKVIVSLALKEVDDDLLLLLPLLLLSVEKALK